MSPPRTYPIKQTTAHGQPPALRTPKNLVQLRITDLPDCLLLRIFSLLPLDQTICVLAASCERFRILTEDFSLWKRRDVQFKTTIPKTALTRLRFFSTKSLQKLNLSGNVQLLDANLRELIGYFKNLTHIDLSKCCRLTPISVACLATYPGKLHTLNFNGCYWFCPDMILNIVLQHSNTLRVLDITGCSRITRDVARISRLAEACSKLHSLSLGWLTFIPSGTNPVLMSPIIDTDVRKFARKCRQLKSLRLYRCHIGDDSVGAVASSCQSMVSLDLSYTYIGDDSLIIIGKFFRELTNLQLAGCWKISDRGLLGLGEQRLRLANFNMKRCVDVSSIAIAHFLSLTPTLRELCLAQCFSVSDIILDSIYSFCPLLAVLDVTGTSISQERLDLLQSKRAFPMAIWDARRLKK